MGRNLSAWARTVAIGAFAPLLAAGAAAAPAAKPIDHSGRPQSGAASYFGSEEAGKTNASGGVAKPHSSMTAASRTLPLGTTAKVTNMKTGQSVQVKVVDRGPYAKKRVMDVSAKAAHQLGMKQDGVAPVKVQPLHEPPKPAKPH